VATFTLHDHAMPEAESMFTAYKPSKGYDEYFSAAAEPRSSLQPLLSSLGQLGIEEINRSHAAAGMLL
jgi:hypothetical protein